MSVSLISMACFKKYQMILNYHIDAEYNQVAPYSAAYEHLIVKVLQNYTLSEKYIDCLMDKKTYEMYYNTFQSQFINVYIIHQVEDFAKFYQIRKNSNSHYPIIGISCDLIDIEFKRNKYLQPKYIYLLNVEQDNALESLQRSMAKNSGVLDLFTPDKNKLCYAPSYMYKLNYYSDEFTEQIDAIIYHMRVMTYINAYENTEFYKCEEDKYIQLAHKVLNNGVVRPNRTGIPTISIFSDGMRFDISKYLPLMTTRYIPLKSIIEELLWFCRGDTDANILVKKGVKIWNGNSSREFLDSRGLHHYPEGTLGPIYGWQWRRFGAEYKVGDYVPDSGAYAGFDQLQYIVDLLKNDPFSRRIMLSAWNPIDFDKMALPPCHVKLIFRVDEIDGEKHLSCKFSMRSSDFLAWSYNVVSYSILTYILAAKCGMKPKEVIYDADDIHIYENHKEQALQQLSREIRTQPVLKLSDEIKNKDWSEITADDFELIGYFPHPPIKIPMAI